MRVSELIERLKSLMGEVGDVEVVKVWGGQVSLLNEVKPRDVDDWSSGAKGVYRAIGL